MELEIDLTGFNQYVIKLITLNNSIIASYIKEVNYIISDDKLKLDKLTITDNEEEVMILVEHCIFMFNNPDMMAAPLTEFLKKQKGSMKQKAAFTMCTADVLKETLIRIVELGKEKIKLLGGITDANIN